MTYRSTFHHMFWLDAGIAAGVFVAVVALMLFAMVHWRAGAGRTLSRTYERTPLEIGYAGVIFLVAIFLVVMSAITWGTEQAAAGATPAMTVRVTAYQWCWRFTYVGTPVAVTADCEAGLFPTLMIPTGRNVRIDLESNDVVHELWIPHLRYKMEAFPDHVNRFDLRVAHTGTWRGLCDEFCGLFHDSMDFRLQAVSPAAFQKWLHREAAAAAPARPTPVGGPPVRTKLGGAP